MKSRRHQRSQPTLVSVIHMPVGSYGGDNSTAVAPPVVFTNIFTFNPGMAMSTPAIEAVLGITLTNGTNNGTTITFENTGYTISANAFTSNYDLLSVVSYASVVGIGAFDDCSTLATVSLPIATNLGTYAFNLCTSLTTISFPQVITLDVGCFSFCSGLTSVSLPSATMLANNCFDLCVGLTSISLPVCNDLGGTAGDDQVFGSISGNNINFTLLTATAADLDVVYLQSNNTVTLILT